MSLTAFVCNPQRSQAEAARMEEEARSLDGETLGARREARQTMASKMKLAELLGRVQQSAAEAFEKLEAQRGQRVLVVVPTPPPSEWLFEELEAQTGQGPLPVVNSPPPPPFLSPLYPQSICFPLHPRPVVHQPPPPTRAKVICQNS